MGNSARPGRTNAGKSVTGTGGKGAEGACCAGQRPGEISQEGSGQQGAGACAAGEKTRAAREKVRTAAREELTPAEKARHVELFAMDVDGVLSDGRVSYTAGGEEIKSFHVRDGLGISVARKAGLHLAVITGRASEMVRIRARELEIPWVFQGVDDKLECFHALLADLELSPARAAFIGDDLNDLAVLRTAGLGFTVPRGAREVQAACDVITAAAGGAGAVREALEFILRSQNRWREVVREYYL